jgi:single-strand DNA-binding protein
MNNLNSVIINGNLTTDCKLERGKNGTAYGGFSIAVNRSVKKGDEWEEVPSFFEVKAVGKLFESQHPYLKKGANVTVEGSLVQENWETKEGEKRHKIVIQSDTLYLSPRKKDDSGDGPKLNIESSESNSEPENQMPPSDEFEQDFPF